VPEKEFKTFAEKRAGVLTLFLKINSRWKWSISFTFLPHLHRKKCRCHLWENKWTKSKVDSPILHTIYFKNPVVITYRLYVSKTKNTCKIYYFVILNLLQSSLADLAIFRYYTTCTEIRLFLHKKFIFQQNLTTICCNVIQNNSPLKEIHNRGFTAFSLQIFYSSNASSCL
jgi:hypothetical protein